MSARDRRGGFHIRPWTFPRPKTPRALSGPALEAHYVTNGIAHARLLAQKSCHVCVPGGLLRPRTEAIIGAAAITALQQFNFTKAFIGEIYSGAILTNRCPDPKYRQLTLVKETEQ